MLIFNVNPAVNSLKLFKLFTAGFTLKINYLWFMGPKCRSKDFHCNIYVVFPPELSGLSIQNIGYSI